MGRAKLVRVEVERAKLVRVKLARVKKHAPNWNDSNRSTWSPLIRSLLMPRLANYSLFFSLDGRESFKPNEGVWKETTVSPSTPQFSTCGARCSSVVRGSQIAQLTTERSRVRLPVAALRNSGTFVYPHIACVFRMRHYNMLPVGLLYLMSMAGAAGC